MTARASARLGVFGGTFDPIHHGHLAVAEAAREELGLARVLFVTSRQPPHRPDAPRASGEDRAEMVALAVASNPAFAVSRNELERDGPSYSVDTLEAIVADVKAAGGTPDVWFILSADAFAGFLSWRLPGRVLELSRLAVLPRDGHLGADVAGVLGALDPDQAKRVRLLDGVAIRLSASAIRRRLAGGYSARYLVPDAVLQYINDHRLYREEREDTAVGSRSPNDGGTITE